MSVYFRIHAITVVLTAFDFLRKQENLCTGFDLSSDAFIVFSMPSFLSISHFLDGSCGHLEARSFIDDRPPYPLRFSYKCRHQDTQLITRCVSGTILVLALLRYQASQPISSIRITCSLILYLSN